MPIGYIFHVRSVGGKIRQQPTYDADQDKRDAWIAYMRPFQEKVYEAHCAVQDAQAREGMAINDFRAAIADRLGHKYFEQSGNDCTSDFMGRRGGMPYCVYDTSSLEDLDHTCIFCGGSQHDVF